MQSHDLKNAIECAIANKTERLWVPDNSNTNRLARVVWPSAEQTLNPEVLQGPVTFRSNQPVLVVLAAGKGTRFGQSPKCSQPVFGLPLARHSIDAFSSYRDSPVICVVGHHHEEVTARTGDDVLYVRSDNPT